MKTYLASPSRGRLLGLLLCLLMLSGTALAADEWHSWEGTTDPNIVKESTPEANGERTDRYYIKDANGIKQLVEINKLKKGGDGKLYVFYHWLRSTDANGATTTEEYSMTKNGNLEGTKTQVAKDGTTTTWTWDKDRWRLKDIKKPETPGPKKAPTGPQVEINPTPKNNPFEFGAGYTFMQTAEEEVESLNGFTISGFYNVNQWLSVGGEFSGLYGSKMISSFGVHEEVALDRYLYLFGARVSTPAGEPVRLYGQVMVGGVHDINDFSFAGGSSSSSADALAVSVGVGVNFQVTNSFSIGPSIHWVPTNFSGGNGDDWQHNWSIGIQGTWHFGEWITSREPAESVRGDWLRNSR